MKDALRRGPLQKQEGCLELTIEGNVTAGVAELQKRAAAGDKGAAFVLSEVYFQGVGAPRDYKKSYAWLLFSEPPRYSAMGTEPWLRDSQDKRVSEMESHVSAEDRQEIEMDVAEGKLGDTNPSAPRPEYEDMLQPAPRPFPPEALPGTDGVPPATTP